MLTRILLLTCLLLAPCWAEDWDAVPQIPHGVVYKPLSAPKMEAAAGRVRGILSPGYKGSDSLAGPLVVCLPRLWESWSQLKLSPGVESIPATFNPGGQGRFFRSQAPILQLDNELRKTLANDGGFRIRRPTTEELAQFWAVIDFDIEEPLLIIESPKRAFLYYSYQDQMVWLDQIR